VAFELAVEKAITLASRVSRKNAAGLLPGDQLEQCREHPEHLDAEREQHHADVGRELDREVPAELRRQVEHEAEDRDRARAG
jgi:hypothetical protein